MRESIRRAVRNPLDIRSNALRSLKSLRTNNSNDCTPSMFGALGVNPRPHEFPNALRNRRASKPSERRDSDGARWSDQDRSLPFTNLCESLRPYGRGSGRRLISWSRGREAGDKRAFFTQSGRGDRCRKLDRVPALTASSPVSAGTDPAHPACGHSRIQPAPATARSPLRKKCRLRPWLPAYSRRK